MCIGKVKVVMSSILYLIQQKLPRQAYYIVASVDLKIKVQRLKMDLQ